MLITVWLIAICGMIIALSLTWSPGPQARMCDQYAKPSVVSSSKLIPVASCSMSAGRRRGMNVALRVP